jgi:hypothetical protein
MTDSTNPAAAMGDGLAGELERLLVSENEALNAVTVGSHAAYHRAADAKLLWLKNNAERILAALRPAQPAAVEVEALREALEEAALALDDAGKPVAASIARAALAQSEGEGKA